MERFRLTPRFIRRVLCMIVCMGVCMAFFPAMGQADSAKQKYMAADDCFKKLRHSSTQQQKVSAWLNCIRRYEAIYRIHPQSSWAPAGMYKAAELYLQLFKRSNTQTHQSRAIDLLARIKNKYPNSAYSGRAKILLKSLPAPPENRSSTCVQKNRKPGMMSE